MGLFRGRSGDALLVAFVVLASCLLPARGLGQEQDRDARARVLFEEGRAAFDAGHYEGALERWRASYELSGRAALLYNIGLVHDRLRKNAEAIAAFESFLHAHPDAPRAEEIRARIRAIRVAM